MSIIKKAVHKFGKWYCGMICRNEWEAQRFYRLNERPVEFGFVFRQVARIYPKSVLDVGTGTTALPHLLSNCGFLVTATDNVTDYWPEGMFNRHFYVINDDIVRSRIKDTFDFITCVSVLEHVEQFRDAVNSMFKLLNPGGYLVLTFPYNEKRYIQNVYKLADAGYGQNEPYICQVFSRDQLDAFVVDNHASIIEQEYWQFWGGEFWTFGEQTIPPRQTSKGESHQLSCILMQKGSDAGK